MKGQDQGEASEAIALGTKFREMSKAIFKKIKYGKKSMMNKISKF